MKFKQTRGKANLEFFAYSYYDILLQFGRNSINSNGFIKRFPKTITVNIGYNCSDLSIFNNSSI